MFLCKYFTKNAGNDKQKNDVVDYSVFKKRKLVMTHKTKIV